MKAVLLVCASALAFASPLKAVSSLSNDIGRPDVPSSSALTGPIVTAGTGPICPAIGGVVSSFTGRNTQSGRLFRNAIPSQCLGKVFPGIYAAGTYNYETFTYTYTNSSSDASCVRVGFNPNPAGTTSCGTNAHMSAYAGSYDPGNPRTNYLGDVGYSQAQDFSVPIAGGSQLVLAVTNTQAAATCSFAFQVVDLPCTSETTANLGVALYHSPPILTDLTPGDAVSFGMPIWNVGPDAAQDVIVSLHLAPGLKFSTAEISDGGRCTYPTASSGGTVTCTYSGAMEPRPQQRFLRVSATVQTASGTTLVLASASSPTFDPMPTNNFTSVTIGAPTGTPLVPVPVPMQSTLGLLLLGGLLAGFGWLTSRRKT